MSHRGLEIAGNMSDSMANESSQICDLEMTGCNSEMDMANDMTNKTKVREHALNQRRALSNLNYGTKVSSVIFNSTWDLNDIPLHDVYDYFHVFNKQFFEDRLNAVDLQINPHMTVSAGKCSYVTSKNEPSKCVIRLSRYILKNQSKKIVLESLLHEMIHAYLFVTDNDDGVNDGHGPNFDRHMKRINGLTGLQISVYYEAESDEEVGERQYWQCSGKCQKKRITYNGPPGPQNSWWIEHTKKCGGTHYRLTDQERKAALKRVNNVNGNGVTRVAQVNV